MNINEVLYLPVKREGLSIGPDEFDCKRRYRTLDGEEVTSSFKAKSKEELLDRQKPEVPKFVADWIERHKKYYSKWDDEGKADFVFRAINDLFRFGEGNQPYDFDIDDELSKWTTENGFKFINSILFGYEVEREKLYTVEIPDPNVDEYSIVLGRKEGKVQIKQTLSTTWRMNCSNQLTEREIRKDFDWAWQQKFAKEVAG